MRPTQATQRGDVEVGLSGTVQNKDGIDMTTKKSKTGHIYLYAVIPGTAENELETSGLFDSAVHTICEGGLAAVVSEFQAIEKLRPERKHLAATQRVLSYLVKTNDVVLPVSFGTVADSEKGIREMLKKYGKDFHREIARVSGKVEMELRVVYQVPDVFEYFVTKYPELGQARDEAYTSNGEPTREQKINIGQQFEQIQTKDREKLTTEVEKLLGSSCAELKHNKPRGENEVMRISCLVNKNGVDGFKKALVKAGEVFDDNFGFEYSDPLPPYNFVDVRVHM